MTITASPLTISRRNAAVSASAWFHTSDPGTFVVDYPSGITGPATVEAAGSRAWRNGLKPNEYLARASVLATRVNVALFVEFNAFDYVPGPGNQVTAIDPLQGYDLCGSIRADVLDRINWIFCILVVAPMSSGIGIYPYLKNCQTSVNVSRTLQNNAAGITGITTNRVMRFIFTYDGTTAAFYSTTGTAADYSVGYTMTGTMGGTEFLVAYNKCKFAKMEGGLPSQAEREAFQSAGTLPAGLAASYQGGHEINPAAPVFYDTSGNELDLSDVDVTYWPEAAASGDTTDTGFTSPLVEVPLTIAADCTAGVKNITLRRTRVGIPARTPALPDAVLYDIGVIPVTVAVTAEAVTIGPDIDCQVPSYPATFNLQLCGNYDGAATVVSDDPNLVPASPVTIAGGVAVVACTVAADVTGATVTATGPGGDTDACAVTVAEVAPSVVPLSIGPSQTLRSGVTSIYLHITGEDGACTVTASPVVGLSGVPATVTIASGEADFTLTKMSAGTYTITATQGALTDTCTIIVPVGFAAATEYDLVQDIADMIETYGVGYHYDPELLTDTGGDLEDRMFTVRETDVVDGPMIGGKTVTIAVDCYYRNRAPSSDAKALIDYLNCEADAPSYVHALFATGGMVAEEQGAQKITYEIQVSLG